MPQLPYDPDRALPGAAAIQLLLQFALDHGVSAESCLGDTGLSPRQLADPDLQVRAEQEVQLMRNLVNALGNIPGIGLQAGLRYRLVTRGVWGFALLSCPTLRAALAMSVRYEKLWNPFTEFHLQEVGHLLVATIDERHLPQDVQAFVVDRDLGMSRSFMRDLVGASLPIVSIALRRSRPTDVTPYVEVFGVEPTFDAQANVIVANGGAILDQPLPGADTEVARQCEAQCLELLKRLSGGGLSGQLRQRLVARPGQVPDMETVASELHITSRTLRRRLADEGTSFRELQDQVREALALQLLADGLTLEHVSDALGYGEPSCFIRAYRRWKGVTPHKDRRR
ncbi:AraC family transcriptional regulator [Pseudomonas sp. NPDC089569]|uniref:AraC family transcriptional regulator n=1 Tax=Pseudomonas sp. NPDC089569 TaxID=3390722 RepID=UPI003D0307A3